MKKTLKVALYILLALVLIVLAYVIYVFAAYYRVEDMQKLGVAHCDAASAAHRWRARRRPASPIAFRRPT